MSGLAMNDHSDGPHSLQRFVEAQNPVYDQVCSELRQGQKRSHWIWFIFPQIEGLGLSPTSKAFAISSVDEAEAYLRHPILGPRLLQCTELVNEISGLQIQQILAPPDDLKFRSSMTLFAHATTTILVFEAALQKYFEGQYDQLTLDRL